MSDSSRIEKIANNLDKLIHDFIPELNGKKISEEVKIAIVQDTMSELSHNDPTKTKLFLTMPQPFITDFVCKNKSRIKEKLESENF